MLLQTKSDSADYSKLEDSVSAVAMRVLSPPIHECTSDPATDHFLDLLVQQIKWRRKAALIPSLRIMSVLVRKRPECMNETALRDVLSGLEHLIDETKLTNTDPAADIQDKLAERMLSARLAYRLFRYYSDQGKEIPRALINWKSLCFKTNEFAEVRNEWDSMGALLENDS